MRIRELCAAVLGTFAVVRVIDHVASSREVGVFGTPSINGARSRALARFQRPGARAPERAPPPMSAPTPSATPAPSSGAEYFIVIGFPVGIDSRNTARRALFRRLWVPEYPNIGRTVRYEFVIGLLSYQGDGHSDEILDKLHEEHEQYGDMAFVNAREATKDPYRGDPKCTGEKLITWFQQVRGIDPGLAC